jgi:hypothetical protein
VRYQNSAGIETESARNPPNSIRFWQLIWWR